MRFVLKCTGVSGKIHYKKDTCSCDVHSLCAHTFSNIAMFTFWRCCTSEDYNAGMHEQQQQQQHSNQYILHTVRRESEQQQPDQRFVVGISSSLHQPPLPPAPLPLVCDSPCAERVGFFIPRNIYEEEEKDNEDEIDYSESVSGNNNNIASLMREQFPCLPGVAKSPLRMTEQLCMIDEPIEEQKDQEDEAPLLLLPPKPKPSSGIARSLRSVSRTAVSPPPPDLNKHMRRPLRKVAAINSGLNRQVHVQQQLQSQQQHSTNYSHSGSWISFFSMASSSNNSNSASSTDMGTSPTWYVGH